MSKEVKFAHSSRQDTNWSLCILCQQDSKVQLVDPANARNEAQPRGYRILAEHLEALRALDALPLNIDICRLNDGSGVEETLSTNSAKWHKSCYSLCNKTQIERAQKRKAKGQPSSPPCTPVKNRLRSKCVSQNKIIDSDKQQYCFFCDTSVGKDEFHRAETTGLDKNVRTWATQLKDTKLLAKLSSSDMPASDAVYHKKCMTSLYTRYKSLIRSSQHKESEVMKPESVALAELISYVEDCQQSDPNTRPIFKLLELVKVYKQWLEQLGRDISQRVNPTRLKEKLLLNIPNLEANKSNYEVVLSFKKDIADVLLTACEKDTDSDAVVLMRAAQIVRKEIFQMKYQFCGSLDDSQYDVLPKSAITLVQMILGGTNIQSQSTNHNKVGSAVSSLTQLLVFNAVKQARKDSQTTRHISDRETLLPLYLGLLVHSRTRKRDLVEVLFEHGLSVSYDRVLQVSRDVGNGAINIFEASGVVCPTQLRNGLFTTGNLDNIDHNPSATSAQNAFHGTAISLTQHPTGGNVGEVRNPDRSLVSHDSSNSRSVLSLPDAYSIVNPAAFPNQTPLPTESMGPMIPGDTILDSDDSQMPWLLKIKTLLLKPKQ